MEHTFWILFIVIVSLSFAFDQVLNWLNTRHWCSGLPDHLRSVLTDEQYLRSTQYYKDHQSASRWEEWLMFALTLAVLGWGGFGWLNAVLSKVTTHFILLPLLFFGTLGLITALISLPFEIYSTFVIEQKYGFNKTTPIIFLTDKLKGILLSVVIGGGILSLILTIYHYTGSWFWLLALGVLVVFGIFSTMFYSSLIVPLFNKQKPLEEGEVRSAIEAFAARTKFQLDNIFVIDGSKRSTKANAYFSGLGRKKRIVLYDTLINTHSTNELVAVLAHEIGHYRHRHIAKGMVLSFLNMGVMLFLLSRFIDPTTLLAHAICGALGATGASFQIGVLAFGLLYSPVSMVIGSLANQLSRRFEYQADAFAGTWCDPNDLQTALKRLSVDHLSNLNPHPWYVFVHYSHPPLISRLEGLEKLKPVSKN